MTFFPTFYYNLLRFYYNFPLDFYGIIAYNGYILNEWSEQKMSYNLDLRFDRYLDPPEYPEGWDCQVCGKEMIGADCLYNSLGEEVCDYCEVDDLTNCPTCGERVSVKDITITVDGLRCTHCKEEDN